MKLVKMLEDHFRPIKSHPGGLGDTGKTDRNYKREDFSSYVVPKDREDFLAWSTNKPYKKNEFRKKP